MSISFISYMDINTCKLLFVKDLTIKTETVILLGFTGCREEIYSESAVSIVLYQDSPQYCAFSENLMKSNDRLTDLFTQYFDLQTTL